MSADRRAVPRLAEEYALPDEPLFTIRAQDHSAPGVVAEWIRANIETAPPEKLRGALEQAIRMREWPHRRDAD